MPEGSRFCTNCGHSLNGPTAPAAAPTAPIDRAGVSSAFPQGTAPGGAQAPTRPAAPAAPNGEAQPTQAATPGEAAAPGSPYQQSGAPNSTATPGGPTTTPPQGTYQPQGYQAPPPPVYPGTYGQPAQNTPFDRSYQQPYSGQQGAPYGGPSYNAGTPQYGGMGYQPQQPGGPYQPGQYGPGSYAYKPPAEDSPYTTVMPMGFYRFHMVMLILSLVFLPLSLISNAVSYANGAYGSQWYTLAFLGLLPIEIIYQVLLWGTTLVMRIFMPQGRRLGLLAYYVQLGLAAIYYLILLVVMLSNGSSYGLFTFVMTCVVFCAVQVPIFIYYWKRKHLFAK